VATGAMAEARDAVRSAAARLREVEVSTAWRTDSGDVAADDAARMFGDVLAESLGQLERVLHTVAVVVEVAAVDYARAEAQASVGDR
jgi:hypothetical protein